MAIDIKSELRNISRRAVVFVASIKVPCCGKPPERLRGKSKRQRERGWGWGERESPRSKGGRDLERGGGGGHRAVEREAKKRKERVGVNGRDKGLGGGGWHRGSREKKTEGEGGGRGKEVLGGKGSVAAEEVGVGVVGTVKKREEREAGG